VQALAVSFRGGIANGSDEQFRGLYIHMHACMHNPHIKQWVLRHRCCSVVKSVAGAACDRVAPVACAAFAAAGCSCSGMKISWASWLS